MTIFSKKKLKLYLKVEGNYQQNILVYDEFCKGKKEKTYFFPSESFLCRIFAREKKNV